MAIAQEVLGKIWAKTQVNAKKTELAELTQRIFASETVPGIHADQRALAWTPEVMAFGEHEELPPLETNGKDCTEQKTAKPGKKIRYAVETAEIVPTRNLDGSISYVAVKTDQED